MTQLPPRREKLHYTFDNRSLEEIGRQNYNLLDRLNRIATRPPQFGGAPTAAAPAPRPKLKSKSEIERDKRQREIDKANLILLRKLQATKPEVVKHIHTTGRGAGAPVTTRSDWSPSKGAAGGAGSARREWVDPTSTLPPRPAHLRLDGGGGAGAGAGGSPSGGSTSGRSGGGALPRSRMFKDPALMALQACREDHLYDK